jgi:hypothetical protein
LKGIKVGPPTKIVAKLVNKTAIKPPENEYPPKIIFTTPIYPPSQNLVNTSKTIPLIFQTM